MRLAIDAPRGCGLVFEPLRGDPSGAGLADAVLAFPDALQRMLHLLAVLVQKVDKDVRGLPVREGLRQVGLLRDPCDRAPDDLAEGSMEARLLSAFRGQVLQVPPVGFESRLQRRVWCFAVASGESPIQPIPEQATL